MRCTATSLVERLAAHHRRQVFGFGGYQKTIIHNISGSNIVYVPTQAVLNGDWSAIESGGPNDPIHPQTEVCIAGGRQLEHPGTTTPYVGNQIPTTSYSQPALNYLKLIPISTDPCGKLTLSGIESEQRISGGLAASIGSGPRGIRSSDATSSWTIQIQRSTPETCSR
jgi:hypothetical protein